MSFKAALATGMQEIWDDPRGFYDKAQAFQDVFHNICDPIRKLNEETAQKKKIKKKDRKARRKESDGVKFLIKNGTARVKGLSCSSNSSYVEIPSFIRKKGERYRVTKVGNDAFDNESSISAVSIDEGIEEIGAGAFYLCCNLQEVYLPDSLEYIGSGAFSSCSKLRGVYIPPNARIHPNAFNGSNTVLRGYGRYLKDYAKKRGLPIIRDEYGSPQVQAYTACHVCDTLAITPARQPNL
ncbi:MAG: leucine-rich repeat domain-containing protein [Clostridiales bacterium]|nr:leucine-rich repeat domain-containing protein [Clostridiales bacterium]